MEVIIWRRKLPINVGMDRFHQQQYHCIAVKKLKSGQQTNGIQHEVSFQLNYVKKDKVYLSFEIQ